MGAVHTYPDFINLPANAIYIYIYIFFVCVCVCVDDELLVETHAVGHKKVPNSNYLLVLHVDFDF